MKSFSYLLIDLFCIVAPVVFSFNPRHSFFKEWKYFFQANAIVALFFIVWDIIFTQQNVWGFTPEYLTGLYVFNLPIEEVLFFIVVPYASTFVYFSFIYFVKKPFVQVFWQKFTAIFAVSSLAFAMLHTDKSYTFFTFLFHGLFLLALLYFKPKYIGSVYLSYFFVIPFFLIVNGLLTGIIWDSPIVWYNDAENLGIRIFTIPVEDTFYGFLLYSATVVLYESIKQRALSKTK